MDDYSFIKIFTVFLLIVSLLATSCAPKTKTITPLSESDRAGIKKVAIHVQVNEELIETSGGCGSGGAACMLVVPALALGLITQGAAMFLLASILEEIIGKREENEKAEKLREDIAGIKMNELMAERIDERFETTGAPFEAEISEIQSPSILAQQGFDKILDITIEKLAIKPCPRRALTGIDDEIGLIEVQEKNRGGVGPLSSDDVEYRAEVLRWNEIYPDFFWKTNKPTKEFLYSADATKVSKEETDEIERLAEEIEKLRPVVEEYMRDSVRTWIYFKGKIISTGDSSVLWDREELYYDPMCERVEEMQNNPDIVVDMLTRAIHDIAVNTVNEIQ